MGACLQQKETWVGGDKRALNREQSGSTKITGWLDLPSETHNAQPLGGWDINFRNVLKASKKYSDSHHGQQLNPKTHQYFEFSGIERVGAHIVSCVRMFVDTAQESGGGVLANIRRKKATATRVLIHEG